MTVAAPETSRRRARSAFAWRASVVTGVAIVGIRAVMAPSTVGVGTPPLGPRLFDALLPIVVAFVMAWAAWRARRDSRRLASAWLLFSLAYMAYGCAELPFALFAVTLGKTSFDYPSLALYLLFYPFFLLGTLRLPPVPLERRDRTALALDMGIVMLGAVFLVWSLVVMPAMQRGGTEVIKVVETVAFPVAGLGVLWSLLTLLFRNLVQPAPAIVRLLAAGAACMIVTDAGYSYHLLSPHPLLWSVLALGWTAAHVLAGLAPARQLTAVDGAWSPAVGNGHQRAPVGSVYLAYITMMAAVVVMVWMHFRWLSAVGGLALVGMIALGAARKVIGLKENELLKGNLRAARDTLEDRVRERTAELAHANCELQREVAERKRAEEGLQLQLGRLAALRAVDAAISGSLDLRVTLDVFLENVISQLEIDAADVLLLSPVSRTLEVFARKGFRDPGPRSERVPMGEGHAGRAAMERAAVIVTDLGSNPDIGSRSTHQRAEGFRGYGASPLVAKGEIKGVLEVFSRNPLAPAGDWLDFLATLGGQGAIAIDSMTMFERTQRSHAELALAYDSTLEGWSLALELRDRETQGHTLRVTDLTLRLAREMGMGNDELVHVRRGALLHDIGKMGIPDAVLLKPGPLDEDEWEIMRRHPVYAFELLSRIPYLRSSLDIPYCHHERWDGSGYPRGLREIQIPLAARIFSVADNWDALSFERPYRSAWPRERVRRHIERNAGALFDPDIVNTFLASCV